MIERIKAIMNYYNLSVNSFSAKIGSKQVTVNQQMNGDRKVSLETVLNIVNSFDEISTQWLLTGKGEMLKSKQHEEETKPITIERLMSIIESQQRTIENLSAK